MSPEAGSGPTACATRPAPQHGARAREVGSVRRAPDEAASLAAALLPMRSWCVRATASAFERARERCESDNVAEGAQRVRDDRCAWGFRVQRRTEFAPEVLLLKPDSVRLQEAVAAYHAANTRAAAAPLGSAEYDEAMDELRQRRDECMALGVNPTESWRQHAQRRLTQRLTAHRPGERERARRSDAR